MADPEPTWPGRRLGHTARAVPRTGPGGPVDPAVQEHEFERFRARTRLHIVEELLRAHELGEQLIAAVEAAEDRAAARAVLMAAPFEFDAIAAEHVLDTQLAGRTQQAIENRKHERDTLLAFLAQP